jgi:Flp pilus assembly protein TadD
MHVRAPWLVLSAVLSLTTIHCGGSAPEPEHPASEPPPLDDDGPDEGAGAAAPASSSKVKEATDAIQAGDFAKAKTLLEAATAESPKDPQAAFYLGVALEGLGEAKPAAEQYKKTLALDSKLTEASTNLSAVLLDAGDADGALAAADGGLKTSPKSPALLKNRAVALSAKGSKDAAPAFRAALEVASGDNELRYLYADALAQSGDAAGAAKEAKPLVVSDDVAVLASAGRLLGKLKAFDDCVAAFDKAIGKKDVAELRVQRGICKHGKKDEAGAESDFVAATKAEPTFAPGFYYLGQHLRGKGDKRGAKAALAKAAELDPKGGVGAAAKKALSELK